MLKKTHRLTKTKKLIILSIPLIVAIGITIYLHASKKEYIHLWPCVIFENTGIACSGCGATRCVSHILRFKFLQAIKYNLAVFILFWIFAVAYLYCAYKVIRYNKFIKPKSWFYLSLIIYLTIFWIVRNFDFYPWHLSSPWS